MTDAPLVTRKLAVLREHRSRIERRRPESIEALEADVDLGRVWSELPRGLRALDAYASEIARFLTRP